MQCDECQHELWKAGEIAPAGVYARVDDQSYHRVTLMQAGPLPASFDGHMAQYCSAPPTLSTRKKRRTSDEVENHLTSAASIVVTGL